MRKARFFEDIAERLCDPCVSEAEQDRLIALLNCNCNYGGCKTPDVPDCAIIADYIVDGAVAFADLPDDPEPGSTYYVISGTNAGEIALFETS